jgi:GntR family transcriptional regulator, transcriptional repressor for pyruvate dehydrogenase complex
LKENKNYQIKQAPRMFEQVIKQIIKLITTESISKGTKIPTERNLSLMLEVSRSSIREGIRVLELLGYLDSRQGEGTFVANPPPFLIPCRVFNQTLDSFSLNHYYDIFLMCSKQIAIAALHDDEIIMNVSLNKALLIYTQNFWEDLANWIKYLGTQLHNPYYLSLWLNTYGLLLENNYFLNLNTSLQINTLADAILERNETKLLELFQELTFAS